jgi:chromosome segregation ATPase
MANDNKKINELVEESEEDTSELEVLSDTVVADPGLDHEAESEAATHAFELFETSDRRAGDSDATLQAELRQRDELVNSLQFDIERLRARRIGLEKELDAREEIAKNLTAELREAQRGVSEGRVLLKARDAKIESLEANLHHQDERVSELEAALEQVRRDAEARRSAMEELQGRNDEAAKKLEALQAALDDEVSRRKRAEDSERSLKQRALRLEEQLGELRSSVASLEQYIEGRKAEWKKQGAELDTRRRTVEEQRRTITRLSAEVAETADLMREEYAARQAIETRLKELQADLERTRGEARQLGAIVSDSEESLRRHEETIASLTRELADSNAAGEEERAEHHRLAGQLEEEQQRSAAFEAEIRELKAGAAPAQEQLRQQQQDIDELSAAAASAEAALEEERNARHRLEQELGALREEAEELRRDNRELSAATSRQEEAIVAKDAELGRMNREIAELNAASEELRAERQSLEEQRDSLEEQAARLHADLRSLEEKVVQAETLAREHTELSGRLAGYEGRITELEQQILRSENYADELRSKFQQQLAASAALESTLHAAEASLREASEAGGRLEADLEQERRQAAELKERLERGETRHEAELTGIRTELDEIRQHRDKQQALAEELASELVDSKESRQRLETRLAEAEEQRRKEVADLERRVSDLRKQLEENERKLANKDAAVNALLSELAQKPDAAPPPADEDVVHRLPERRSSHAQDERSGHDRDRVTRLLVGNIDGQMLRFPLFKDKLTIGRTAHNDIQIKAQYVSRRHAVVVSDDDCTRVVDWGSKNGVYVNGIRVSEQTLKNGDRLTIGTAQFRFEERAKR